MADQSRIRFGYLFERAARLSPSNLIEFAKQAKPVTRKPIPLIIADMLWCSVRYELGFRDYAVWDFATLKGKDRATWMTHPKSHRLNVALNSAEHRVWFSDKVHFYERFSDLLGREWVDARSASPEAFAEFVARNPRVVVKPAAGVGGGGVELRDISEVGDSDVLRQELIATDQVLVEAVIEQDPVVASLHPASVNTVRVITFLAPDDRLHVLASVLRIGNGASVDNFASGGLYTLLDEHGVANFAGVDKNSQIFERHPLTGVAIAGFQVPGFDRILTMLEDAARRVPEVPYVGWDIAVTPNGPALIEGNHNSSVFQTKPTVSGITTGLLPVYQAAIGFK